MTYSTGFDAKERGEALSWTSWHGVLLVVAL
jgi:hypothetical protein